MKSELLKDEKNCYQLQWRAVTFETGNAIGMPIH